MSSYGSIGHRHLPVRQETRDIIEESTSSYSNLLVVVMMDGRVRLHLDARRINHIIILNREASEGIDEILQ